MKSKFVALITIVVCIFSFSPIQAQRSFQIQNHQFETNLSLNKPSSFITGHLNPTGFQTLDLWHKDFDFKTSLCHFNTLDAQTKPSFFQNKKPLNIYSVGVSALGIGYGFAALHSNKLKALNLSTKNEIREDHPFFRTHIDDYLQFSPAAAVIGLNLAGVKGKHSFKDELIVYGISSIIMIGAVRSLKPLTHELRPDGSAYNSFPSGHTATAFAAAEWLRMEYGHKSPWIGVAGYAVATSIGVLRVYNNRHWVSDVVAGAAIGFLSTRIAYAVYPWVKRHIFHSKRKPKRMF